jgi:hypothetical protein
MLLSPIDLAENPIELESVELDGSQISKVRQIISGTYTFNTGKRSDKDIDAGTDEISELRRIVMGTYTNNGGRRDSDG